MSTPIAPVSHNDIENAIPLVNTESASEIRCTANPKSIAAVQVCLFVLFVYAISRFNSMEAVVFFCWLRRKAQMKFSAPQTLS